MPCRGRLQYGQLCGGLLEFSGLSLRSRYASLFTSSTDTMRSFFAQPDHMGVFHYVIDCLDFMMI